MATTTFKASGETVIPRAAKDGANGEKGDSGLTITFSKASLQLAYDGSNGSGLTGTGTGNSTTLKVVENGTEVTSKVTNIAISETKNCYVSHSGTSFYISSLPWQKVVYGSTSMNVPYDSGYFVVSFTYGGNTYTATCTFSVDIVAVLGKQTLMSGALETEQGELRQTISQVEVNAKSVSISVSEKAVGRRNMLVGSAASIFGEGWGYMSGGSYIYSLPCEQILKNGGIDGVNCLRCRAQKTASTTFTYGGFRWHGQYQQGNIKVEKGKTYTLSFWGKTSSPSTVSFLCETIYQGSQTDTSRPAGYSGPSGTLRSFTASTADSWTLFSAQIEVPSDASYEYLEVNIFVKQNSYSVGEAYICRPMMEEGEYMGWSRSELDYDYQGGNLLDNARTLVVGGNLSHVGSSTVTAKGFDGDCSLAHIDNSSGTSDKELLCWKAATDGFTFQLGQDYTLSFLAKGSGNINVFVYCNSNNTAKVFTETSLGVVSSANNGASAFALSTEWKRYWVHVRPISDSPLPTDVLFRALAGCDAYIAQPKLEEGATMTGWTERKTDLVERTALLATGIDVENKKVTVTADTFAVRNNRGVETMLVTQDGKLNSEIVTAKTLETVALDGTRILIQDGLMKFFNPSGMCNIQFGINADGYSVLSYYDNEGRWLYDLGPKGVDAATTKSASLEDITCVLASDFFGTASIYQDKTYTIGSTVYDLQQVLSAYYSKMFGNNRYVEEDAEIERHSHVGYTPFDSTNNTVHLYKYTAAKLSNAYIKDTAHGIPDAAAAEAADGKYFTGTPSYNSTTKAFTNLASGLYFLVTAAVQEAPYPAATSDTGTFRFPAYFIKCITLLNGKISTPTRIYSTLMRTVSV